MGCIGSRLSHFIPRTSRGGLSESRNGSLTRGITHPTQPPYRWPRRGPNVFPVLNVDEGGRALSNGKLEVSETDLVLHIRGKTPLSWPLRCLRRYGYENDLFSFESGRRCPTGAGIYAFKCERAQSLFNLLQAEIQGNQGGNSSQVSLPPSTPAPTSPISPLGDSSPTNLSPSPTFDYVNIATTTTNLDGGPGGRSGVQGSVPLSPIGHGTSMDEDDPNGKEHPVYMNVKSSSNVKDSPARGVINGTGNGGSLPGRNPKNPSMSVSQGHNGTVHSLTSGGSSVYYTNVDCGPGAQVKQGSSTTKAQHSTSSSSTYTTLVVSQPDANVNYAELDLQQKSSSEVTSFPGNNGSWTGPGHDLYPSSIPSGMSKVSAARRLNSGVVGGLCSPNPTESPRTKNFPFSGGGSLTNPGNGDPRLVMMSPGSIQQQQQQQSAELGYATIDFDRTAALSAVTRSKIKLDLHHSSSTDREEEEETSSFSATMSSITRAVRRTRHNSTAL